MIPFVTASVGVMLGTALAGWNAVPLVGFVIGLAVPSSRPVRTVAAASALGWGALLALGALGGPVGEVAGLTGQVLNGLPGIAVIGITLIFPALIGAAAAGVGSALREMGGKREAV